MEMSRLWLERKTETGWILDQVYTTFSMRVFWSLQALFQFSSDKQDSLSWLCPLKTEYVKIQYRLSMDKNNIWICDNLLDVFYLLVNPQCNKYILINTGGKRVKTISTFCLTITKEMSGQRISLFQKFISIWKEELVMNVLPQPEQAHCDCKAIIMQHSVPVGNKHTSRNLIISMSVLQREQF